MIDTFKNLASQPNTLGGFLGKAHLLHINQRIQTMTDSQIKLTDSIKAMALANYEVGGHYIVECLNDDDILERFDSIEDAKQFMEVKDEMQREIESTIW